MKLRNDPWGLPGNRTMKEPFNWHTDEQASGQTDLLDKKIQEMDDLDLLKLYHDQIVQKVHAGKAAIEILARMDERHDIPIKN